MIFVNHLLTITGGEILDHRGSGRARREVNVSIDRWIEYGMQPRSSGFNSLLNALIGWHRPL